MKSIFFLTNEQKAKRVEFSKYIIEKNINYDQIFWTDETKIYLSQYVNDNIRLSEDYQKKLKIGDPDDYKTKKELKNQ